MFGVTDKNTVGARMVITPVSAQLGIVRTHIVGRIDRIAGFIDEEDVKPFPCSLQKTHEGEPLGKALVLGHAALWVL